MFIRTSLLAIVCGLGSPEGPTLLCNAEGDAGGGGGTTTTDDPPPPAPPKYVTEDQLNKAITKRLNEGFTSFERKLTGTIQETLTGLATQIDSSLDAKIAALKPEDKNAPPPADLTNHPIVKGLEKTISDLTHKVKATEDAAADVRQKARAQNLRTQLAELLTSVGVKDPARNKHAVTNLIANGTVDWSKEDENALVFADNDGPLDIKTGLAGWAKGEDAKIYIAPTVAQGSGDRGGGKGPGPGKPGQYKRGDFGAALMQELGGMQLIVGAQPPATTK